jgi:hypothetical protein
MDGALFLANFDLSMRVFILVLVLSLPSACLQAQEERRDMTDVTYEQLYDEPYNVNKFFIGFQPFYGEVFATNVNAGFGVDAHYFHKNKADFRAHFRKTYSSGFFDMNRENALKNSGVDNRPAAFGYLEAGMTWHAKDFEEQGKTKLFLYKKSYKGNVWAGRVPLHVEVPCRVRKIYGARVGTVIWNSTLDVSRALQIDNKTNVDLAGFDESVNLFSNIHSAGLYAGGSFTWIRNIAVGFDQYESNVDDGIVTLFADIFYSPYLKVDDIEYEGTLYNTGILRLKSFGARVGLDGKFNRKLSWGYGGEIGYRPSVSGLGFFATFKMAIPLHSTNFAYKVNATPKE